MAEEDAQAQDLRKKYEIIVENIGEGLVTYNRNMIVTFANDKLSKILGYKKDEIVGTRVTWFFTGKSKKKVEKELEARMKGKASYYNAKLKTKKGKELLLFISGAPILDGNRKFDGGVAIVSDITEKKELEDKLNERSKELEKEIKKRTNLLADLYRGIAVTEAKNRLAWEIHDFCAQTLVSSILKIDLCERVLGKDPDNLKRELKELKKMLRGSIKATRNVMLRLRLPDFHRMGFTTVVKQYVEEFRKKTGITCNLTLRLDKTLPARTQLGIYRIIREAMSNVRKHSMAKKVDTRLKTDKRGNLHLIIRDDGKGFELDSVSTRGRYARNFGLIGMEEQAKLLGGNFAVESAKRHGTKIKVKVPLEQ